MYRDRDGGGARERKRETDRDTPTPGNVLENIPYKMEILQKPSRNILYKLENILETFQHMQS